jgi:class 3 adenylate cyclase/tetratricopeptide (TPR) repeat protein
MESACPNCGAKVPLGVKFCGECGHKLSVPLEPSPRDLSLDEKLAKIQRYLPKGLTEKILSQRDKIEGERKQVTVMFCDMEGFTPLSERLGAEEAYSIMDKVYEILIHKVHEYEGTVNDMTGDGIVALFGAPIALEDAPQRAIRSAYSIHRDMATFSDQLKQERGIPPIKMRIGIHTGPVVVGTLGNDLRVEFKAVGDTVNLASRMEGLAEAGTTYVTEDTFKLTEGLFRFEALGELEVKGREGAVKTYRVIAPSTRRTRFDVSAERGLTPFVGRERELELLLDGFERSREGRGQAFSIIAEAGVGKSRLLYEFRKAVANEDVTFLEGRCLSYSRGVSYHPVIDVLKSNFDIGEGDGDLEIGEKVTRGLKILGTDEASILPYILELLSVKESGIEKIPLSPEAKKDRILEALKRIVLKGSEIRPLILAYEDLHWIDKSSEESLKDLLDAISGARVFLIFTYRPEFVHTWGGRSYHSQVNLSRLSNRESLTMVSHLLGTAELDRDLEQLILGKTEGVPFFIEELISSLKDQRIIEKKDNTYYLAKDIKDVTVPSTIQDVIMARVDSLPEGAKGLLQTGSVAGREFSHDLIKKVTDLSEEELWSHLSVLKDSELLYERGIYPQSAYVFKHALTQEVAYNTLLHKRRRETHEKIGKAMEQIYADRLEEFSEMLAYHSLEGEDWQRAYSYSLKAGLRALSLSVYEEAQRYFEAALSALRKLPSERARIEQEIDLRFNMRSALFPLGRHDDWANHVREGEALAKEIGDKVRLAKAYYYLSSHHWFYQRHREAIELCEEGLGLAEAAGDLSVRITTMFHLGVPLLWMGEYERQVELQREVAQSLSGPAAFNRHGMAGLPSVLARGALAWGLAELGEFEEAEDWGREGIEIAEQVKNALSTTLINAFLALAYLRSGKHDPAIELLQKALALIQDAKVQAMFSFSAGTLGHAHLLMGRPDLALPILEEAARPQNLNVSVTPPIYPITELAEAYRLNGQIERAIERAEEAVAIFGRTGERGFGAWALYVMAKIQASQGTGQMEQAIHSYRQAIDQATELGMRPLLAHCHLNLGQFHLENGRTEEARAEIKAAVDLYRSMDMSFWLPQAETALAEIAGVTPP